MMACYNPCIWVLKALARSVRRVAEVDATAVYFLFDVVRTHREAELADEATGQKTPNPIQILFANPSKQVVREFELADLVNYASAHADLLLLPSRQTSITMSLRVHNLRECLSRAEVISHSGGDGDHT